MPEGNSFVEEVYGKPRPGFYHSLKIPDSLGGKAWVEDAAVRICAGLAASPDSADCNIVKAAWKWALLLWEEMPKEIKEEIYGSDKGSK